MKTKIIVASILLIVLIASGCTEEGTSPLVSDNMTPIEHLAISVQGCQSSENLLKTNDITYDYANDSLRIAINFMTNCAAKFSHNVKTDENTIEIYLTNIRTVTAKCICNFKETFMFYAESPKKIKVVFYYYLKSTDEFEVLESRNIEI